MPLYRLVEEMPYEEFLIWVSYFERRPVGWRSDLRAAYQLQAAGVKKSPQDIFSSLKAVSKTNDSGMSIRGSAMFKKLLNAKGGDSLPVLMDLS